MHGFSCVFGFEEEEIRRKESCKCTFPLYLFFHTFIFYVEFISKRPVQYRKRPKQMHCFQWKAAKYFYASQAGVQRLPVIFKTIVFLNKPSLLSSIWWIYCRGLKWLWLSSRLTHWGPGCLRCVGCVLALNTQAAPHWSVSTYQIQTWASLRPIPWGADQMLLFHLRRIGLSVQKSLLFFIS